MNTVKIDFLMKIDGNLDKSFTTYGIIENNRISFQDLELQNYEIEFSKDSISLKKSGELNLEIYFLLRQLTQGVVSMDQYRSNITVFTHLLNVSLNQIELHYDLMQKNTIISKHQMKMEWIEKWKEKHT